MTTEVTQDIDQKRNRLQRLVLLGLGLLYVFLTPPFRAADEITHFLRAYGVSEGQFVLEHHSRKAADAYLDWHRTFDENQAALLEGWLAPYQTEVPNIAWNTSVYSPIGYLPAGVGIGIAERITAYSADVNILLTIMRLITFGSFFAGVSWAMTRFRAFSDLIFTLASTPMILALGTTATIDFMLNWVALAVVPLALIPTSARTRVAAAFTMILLVAATKPTYFPILLIGILGLAFYKGLKASHWALVIAAAGLALLLATAWNQEIFTFYAEPNPIMEKIFAVLNRDPQHQIALLRSSPLLVPALVANTTGALKFPDLLRQFVGQLGYQEFPVAWWAVGLWILNLGLASVVTRTRIPQGKARTYMVSLVMIAALGAYVILVLSTFVMLTPVGGSEVAGIFQGRYFHPILIPVFMLGATLIPVKLSDSKRSRLGWFVLLNAVILNVHALLVLLQGVAAPG